MDKNVVRLNEAVAIAEIDKKEFIRLGNKTTICFITTKNGHEIVGQSAPIDPSGFNPELGEKYAFQDGLNKLMPLLAYEAQTNLFNRKNS